MAMKRRRFTPGFKARAALSLLVRFLTLGYRKSCVSRQLTGIHDDQVHGLVCKGR